MDPDIAPSTAETPEPPYYAVIFTSVQKAEVPGYAEMAERMETLAREQPGYLGIESAHQGIGITVSYWRDEESIRAWKSNVEHLAAQRLGKERWYREYHLRVARVERAYDWTGES